jgi:hypothetical protein
MKPSWDYLDGLFWAGLVGITLLIVGIGFAMWHTPERSMPMQWTEDEIRAVVRDERAKGRRP